MCSICGIFDFEEDIGASCACMNDKLRHRGPDGSGSFFEGSVCFAHNRLAVMDIESGAQPMSITHEGKKYTIVYNGELYNMPELKKELLAYGIKPKTRCDTELVLWSYIIWREFCPQKLNGIFAFAVYESGEEKIFLARDRFGVKPLFYTYAGKRFLFASEVKALLSHKGVRAEVDKYGLWELLYLAPVTLPHSAVFRGIRELGAAECGYVDRRGAHFKRYWRLEAKELHEKRSDIIENTRQLLVDAIERQLVSDVPLCTFLSGGLDSSIITAVANEAYKRKGERLCTYSFEYEDNKNFERDLFQPNSDDDYALWLAETLGTEHTVLTVPTDELADRLFDAATARDLPGQADIDSSLWYFCREVKKKHTVALSGECSDEIFGGYPWFYRPEMLNRNFFPWLHEPRARISLFENEAIKADEGYAYISEIYRKSVSEADLLESDSDEMKNSRIATCLSVQYFMTNLLSRKDRMSMANALEVRVPFGDHRILEYVYNVPWSIKFENGVEKALLRNAMKDYLPERIINRKKSPYPKTHNPKYEEKVKRMLFDRLANKNCRLKEILSEKKLREFAEGEDKTWFGQLMSRAQLFAWLIELDVWFDTYSVEIVN